MENFLKKYELQQDGKKFLLTSDIKGNSIRLTCSEIGNKNSQIYIGDFTLDTLRQINSSFRSMLTIKDAQDLINKTIEEEKITIETKGNFFLLSLFFLNENQNINLPLKGNNSVQITYSPPKYLPVKKVYFPPIEIRRPTIYYNEEKKDNNIVYPAKTRKIDKLSLPLSPQRNVDILHQSSYASPTIKKNNTYIQQSLPAQSKTNNCVIGSPPRTEIQYSSRGNPYNPYNNYHPVPQTNQNSQKRINISQTNNPYNGNKKVLELQSEINRIKPEHEQLKVQTSRLFGQIEQLKGEIELLNKENSNLKNSQNILQNDNENNLLKQQIEKLEEENVNIKNEKDSEFEQLKKLKDDEINLYKSKLDDLLKSRQEMINENNDLKVQMQEILKDKNFAQSKYQELLSSRDLNNSFKENIEITRGEIFQNDKELELVSKKICGDYHKINITLLYKATVDSDRAEVFHEKCDNEQSTLVLIKSGNGKRFGGYTSCSWKGDSIDKKDDNAFVFSLDKMEIYDIIPGEDAIGCYPKYGPVFLGCQIRIYDEAFKRGGTTFKRGINYDTKEDYELSGGLKKFNVEEIEVYGIELE